MKPVSVANDWPVDGGGIRTYRFPALAELTHAVFTRLGGVSPAPWQSLNLSSAVGDRPEVVQRNFQLACQTLGVETRQTVACHLVHGNEVLVAEAGHGGTILGKADALITQSSELVLTMRYADCVPLLFYDPQVQAVGLAHAGWRGTMQNVMASVVTAMVDRFGSRRSAIRVVVGPSIGPCCYQVGREVFDAAQQAFDEPDRFFRQRETGLYFDLWRANGQQARQAGLKQITGSQLCTACRTNEFFSHRAEKGKTGRFGVFLSLRRHNQTAQEADG